MKMIDKIKQHIAEAKAFSTKNKEELEAFRIKYLGSKGLLKEFFSEFKNVPNDQKKEFGQVINLWKTIAEEKVKSIQEELESKEEIKGFYGDLTRPSEPLVIGSRHPISLLSASTLFSTISTLTTETACISTKAWRSSDVFFISPSTVPNALETTMTPSSWKSLSLIR
jgi:phenylalanyl-tRNA synthetase alpha chain